MSTFQDRKQSFKRQLLTSASAGLLGHLETSISGYEEEINRQRKLLDLLSKPDKLLGTDFPADVQQLLVNRKKEKSPTEQHESSSSRYQQNLADGEDCRGSDPDRQQLRSNDSDCSEPQDLPDTSPLTTHQKVHQEKKPLTCTVCGLQRRFRSQMKVHMRTHTGEKPYSCPVCGKRFSQIGVTKQHRLVHEKVKPFGCTDCGRSFFWHFQIKRHKCLARSSQQDETGVSEPDRKQHPERDSNLREKTEADGETDDSDGDFWKETRRHQSGFTYQRNKSVSGSEKGGNTDRKSLICPDDETKPEANNHGSVDGDLTESRAPQSASNHQRNKEVHKKQFSCGFCGKGFLTAGYLTRHVSVHTGEKPLSCIVCEKRFCVESELISHECVGGSSQLHHRQTEEQIPDRKLFSCSLCAEGFATHEDLNVHFRRHTRCSVCNAGFSDTDSLVQHMRSHGRQTQFSCSICGKDFTWRRHLTKHMELHTNEENDLGDGVLTHTRENTFRCSVCNAGFSDVDSLLQHTRSHTRKTEFRYSVCRKDFTWKQHLTKRTEIQKKKKMFRCSVCAAEFVSRYLLNKHKRVHGQTEKDSKETAAGGEGCGGPEPEPEPVRNSHPHTHLQPHTEHNTTNQSKSRKRPSGSNSVKTEVFESDRGCNNNNMTAVSFNNHQDNSADSNDRDDLWSESREAPSDVTSPNVCGSDTALNRKRRRQQFPAREGLSPYTALHTEVQREVKQEEAEPPHIKEEQEEAEISKFTFSPVPVKSEEGEEEAQSSQLHHRHTEEETDSDERPEPHLGGDDSVDSDFWKDSREPHSAVNSERDSVQNPFSGSESSDRDTDDSDFWKDDRKLESELNSLKHDEVEGDVSSDADRKPFSCSECGKKFLYPSHLKTHMSQHAEKTTFVCSICGQKCLYKSHLKIHMRTHTGEKPFACPVCGKKYAHKASMQSHMSVHTEQQQYSCNVCCRTFAWRSELKYHQCVGESSREQTSRGEHT